MGSAIGIIIFLGKVVSIIYVFVVELPGYGPQIFMLCFAMFTNLCCFFLNKGNSQNLRLARLNKGITKVVNGELVKDSLFY